MARDGIDLSELDEYADWVAKMSRNWPKKVKKSMQKSGTELKRRTLRQIRLVNLGTKTGNYKAGIKRGKFYTKDGASLIRVYSNAPHAHLIEEGHAQVVNPGKGKGNGHGVRPGKGIGRKVGYVAGREVFAKAEEAYTEQFHRNCEDLLDEVVDEICK